MATVYIETSIVSYLTARPSRNVVLAAHQAITREWWRQRTSYQLRVSQLVLDEAAGGDAGMGARRVNALTGVPVIDLTQEASALATDLVIRGALPRKALVDAFHIGIAASHHLDYLLTWNYRHLANAAMRGTIEAVCRSAGLVPPVICTPEELPARRPS